MVWLMAWLITSLVVAIGGVADSGWDLRNEQLAETLT